MINAIRILTGLAMLALGLALLFAFVTFSMSYKSQVASGWLLALNLTALSIPFISSWLLLSSVDKRKNWTGLVLAIAFIAYLFISQS